MKEVILTVLLMIMVGIAYHQSDLQEVEQANHTQYCDMVQNGFWPDYKQSFEQCQMERHWQQLELFCHDTTGSCILMNKGLVMKDHHIASEKEYCNWIPSWEMDYKDGLEGFCGKYMDTETI
jgi:hypothetical protein